MLEEKEALEEKLAISGYELRLAQEDILKLKTELEKKADFLPNSSSKLSSFLSQHLKLCVLVCLILFYMFFVFGDQY